MQKRLVAHEVAYLWNSYLTNTMGIWASRLFLSTASDNDIRSMLEFAEELAIKDAENAKKLLVDSGYPLPQPFDENDVNFDAKPLYTDNFILLLKYALAQAGLSVFTVALNSSVREDVCECFADSLHTTSQLLNRCMEIMVKKGLHQPDIQVSIPEKVDKIDSQKYLSGWFSKSRPLNAQEIGMLVYNYRATEIHKEFIRGCVKVTKIPDLQKHYQRGVDIFQKQLAEFQDILSENGLPQQPTWESEVLDVSEAPFSERLMFFKHSALTTEISSRYGMATANSMRKDLGVHFMRLMTETIVYAEDAANLVIKHKFMDEMPMMKGPRKNKN